MTFVAPPSVVRTPPQAARLGTVLGVWAHPDDETYLSSGLMALARRAGNRVVCVTATRGERGTDDPGRWPPGRLARTRDLEVRAAMAILGVEDHRCLGFEDGTLADLARADGIRLVMDLIEEVAPDTIVTFGPEGMTGHPDHRAVAAWVTGAWRAGLPDAGGGRRGVDRSTGAAGRHPRLLRATTTARFADEFADVHDALPVFGAGLPLRTPEAEVALAVRLDEELRDVKLAALRAQATQVAPLVAALGEDRFRAWWREETFTEVAVPAPAPRASTDGRRTSSRDLQNLTTSSPSPPLRLPSESRS